MIKVNFVVVVNPHLKLIGRQINFSIKLKIEVFKLNLKM